MRILLDESLPRDLRARLPEHDVATVVGCGWSGIKNGKLLALAATRFDVFLTADQNLEFQQNLPMEHLALPNPPGFTALSKADQIQYLQQLWDLISEQPGELPIPTSHLELAEERLAEYRADPSRARSAFDVIDRLRGGAAKNR